MQIARQWSVFTTSYIHKCARINNGKLHMHRHMHVASFILCICSRLTVYCSETKEDPRSEWLRHAHWHISGGRDGNHCMHTQKTQRKNKRLRSVAELFKAGWVLYRFISFMVNIYNTYWYIINYIVCRSRLSFMHVCIYNMYTRVLWAIIYTQFNLHACAQLYVAMFIAIWNKFVLCGGAVGLLC